LKEAYQIAVLGRRDIILQATGLPITDIENQVNIVSSALH
jgi:hypothetical protein